MKVLLLLFSLSFFVVAFDESVTDPSLGDILQRLAISLAESCVSDKLLSVKGLNP